MVMTGNFTKKVLLTLTIIVASITASYAQKPQLIINIVVGSMRSNDLVRYEDNFQQQGFKRLMTGGVTYTNAYYDYALTSTAAGLATFATGAQPSVHGAIGEQWWSYIDSSSVSLIEDKKVQPVPFSTGTGSYSPYRLNCPTLSDMVVSSNSQSKSFTVALDPLSAIILSGQSGTPYWVENNKTHWTTSSAYSKDIPAWVKEYNSKNCNAQYTLKRWTPLHLASLYHNSEVAVIEDIKNKSTNLLSNINLNNSKSAIGQMRYTPAGNTMLLKFASTLITKEKLGEDIAPDVLNICLDTSRYIASTYGPESMEYEDMLYRLDKDLGEFLTFVYSLVDNPLKVAVVVTSDHGTSPSYNPIGGRERERFNVRQMEVIVNAFLGARYGSDSYVLGFANNALYLNHQLLNNKQLSIDTIREEIATFMLQLRGISSAISASSLRNTSFAEGRSRLMQQSYFATRSGDVIIDFMPGWIIEDNSIRSSSDAGYNYDRRVPLIIYGILKSGTFGRDVNMTEVAPTLTTLLGIDQPWASTASPLSECITIK